LFLLNSSSLKATLQFSLQDGHSDAETVLSKRNPVPILNVYGNQSVRKTSIYEIVRYRTETVRF
jgi:hypothetical protein